MLVGWWGGQGGVCPLLLLQRQEVGGLLPVGPSRLAGFNEAGSVLLVGTLGAAGERARKGRERGRPPHPRRCDF